MDRDELYQTVCRLDPMLAMDFASAEQEQEGEEGGQDDAEAVVGSEAEGA